MSTDFGFRYTEPQHWICKDGRPSDAGWGLPSFESEDGQLWVYDFLIVFPTNPGNELLVSRDYGMVALVAPDDMVPLHHSPAAWWSWRPVLYRLTFNGWWEALGSQQELGWRFGLMEAQHAAHAGAEFTFPEADERADAILREYLSPQQALELEAFGWFRCRGGRTGNLYKVDVGNGFEILDKRTCETVVSYCLHTEAWMPHGDIALATKLALEDAELEVECLENARQYPRGDRRPVTLGDVIASRLERDLIPRRRELIVAC